MLRLTGRCLVLLSFCATCLYTFSGLCRGADSDVRSAAELLPASVAIYAEVPRPNVLLADLWDHPLHTRLQSIEAYQQALNTPKFGQFQFLVGAIEAQIGMSWRESVEMLTAQGIFAAVDAKTGGTLLLIRAGDQEKLAEVSKTLLRIAQNEAQRQGTKDALSSEHYRGIDIYRSAENRLAVIDDWLLLTNQARLGQQVLNRYLDDDRAQSTLALQERFQQAEAARSSELDAWAYVDIASLREAGVAKDLYRGRAKNPGAELIFGGLLSTLQHTPYVTFEFDLDSDHIQLTAAMAHEPSYVGEERHYFFGPEGEGKAAAPLQLEEVLLSLSTYRNVSQMWLHAPDLFDENVNANLSQADSNLSTLFGGRNFGEEILGAFGPEIQIVVVRQDLQHQETQPAIHLPAGAVLFRLKDQETMQPELRRTFQSLIGFLNIVGAMNGQPQLDMDMQTTDDIQVVAGRYLPTQAEKGSKDARLQFNFSPSVAFRGDRFVLASTEQLARQLVASDELPVMQSLGPANTTAVVDIEAVKATLKDNREQLVARTMLAEGFKKEKAEQQVDAIFHLLDVVQLATLQLATDHGELALELEVTFVDPAAGE